MPIKCQCGKTFFLAKGEALRVIQGEDDKGYTYCIDHVILQIGKEVVEVR